MLNFFKRSQSSNDKILERLSAGDTTTSGQMVNASTAEGLPAVYCAVSTIAESVASLPIHVYRKQPNGDKERANGHYIERLLNHSPNPYQTGYDFKIALMRSVLLRGNGYAEIEHDGAGRPSALHFMHPDSVLTKKLSNNRLGYQITTSQGKQRSLLQEEMLHIRYHSDDGIIGKSPIQVCRDSLGLGLALQTHGASQFKNAARPSGLLTTDTVFKNPDALLRLKDQWNKTYSGSSNSGKTAVLEGGLKFQPISVTNSDAEWLQSRHFSIADVARIFKLSPIFLMDYSNSTYSNFSEAQRAYLSQSLRPWLTNLQSAFSSRFISERNQSNLIIEFETKDLLRATAEERFNVYDAAIRNGIMCPNEARRSENLPARIGGDEFSQSWIQKGQPDATGGDL
jgi:HK97 family phage portal protein